MGYLVPREAVAGAFTGHDCASSRHTSLISPHTTWIATTEYDTEIYQGTSKIGGPSIHVY